jgi:hypothetical protein
MHEIFFENLRNPARNRRAGLMRQFRFRQLDSTKFVFVFVFLYDTHGSFYRKRNHRILEPKRMAAD